MTSLCTASWGQKAFSVPFWGNLVAMPSFLRNEMADLFLNNAYIMDRDMVHERSPASFWYIITLFPCFCCMKSIFPCNFFHNQLYKTFAWGKLWFGLILRASTDNILVIDKFFADTCLKTSMHACKHTAIIHKHVLESRGLYWLWWYIPEANKNILELYIFKLCIAIMDHQETAPSVPPVCYPQTICPNNVNNHSHIWDQTIFFHAVRTLSCTQVTELFVFS